MASETGGDAAPRERVGESALAPAEGRPSEDTVIKLRFAPTRADGLERLSAFVPKAGAKYRANRNRDEPGHANVSGLSPYIRHRMVTEEEVLAAVLGRFAPSTAEKFVQEVFWRTYFKGWLEMRPGVWHGYRDAVAHGLDRVATEEGLRRRWEAACTGETGIDPFDHWARELVETGYLHNHARMWFASIWTFTLDLPWELGADFFLRHLLDGDPASNTLGWRWVVGLHTPGRVYVARPDNIARYTEGRYGRAGGLAANPEPAPGTENPKRQAAPKPEAWEGALRTGLLLTEDDLSPSWLLDAGLAPVGHAVLGGVARRSPLAAAPAVHAFAEGAVADMRARYGGRLGAEGPTTGLSADGTAEDQVEAVVDWARRERLEQVVAPYPPVGPAAEAFDEVRPALAVEGIRVARAIRAFDTQAWPYATGGYYRFKEKIPKLLGELRGLRSV